MKRYIFFFLALVVLNTPSHAFQIYAFVPYPIADGPIGRAALPNSRSFFSKLGIKPVQVIYEFQIFEDSKAINRTSLASLDKINKTISDLGNSADKEFISLDVESWNRFSQSTPEKYLDLIKKFREASPNSKISLYATVPQIIYKWNKEDINRYDELNSRYAYLANYVDYLSPSFYNKSGRTIVEWTPIVDYSMEVSKKIAPGKPIIPYITPELRKKNQPYRWLTYEEMYERLDYLKKSGASGVIVWGSGNARDAAGELPVLRNDVGWIKALADFQNGK
ncbi:hypothetical protein EYB34_01980 [Bordetella trematum]|uniref:hypothetical protein n=1 Tax=Bordetella trematum TaxID=123899 RepID=UPI00140515E2|nr:hypothetical protein [Bordetella trematum]QIM70230.1 hypothetical protein EYB34_01980 [Bordetella trematum]